MTCVATLGYQGLTSDEWLEVVRQHRIDVVVDVRDVPQSRKPGFSKTKLGAALGAAGIEYRHAPEFGTPRKWREDLSAGLDFSLFAKRYTTLLDSKTDELRDLHDSFAGKRICLICYEEDPSKCHRSLVAQRLKQMYDDVGVEHLRHE